MKCFQNNLGESSDRGRESGADRISGSRVEREGGSIDIFFQFRRLHAACKSVGSNGIYQRRTSCKNQNILAGQRNEKRRRLILLRFHFVACGTDTFYSCLYLLGITQIALAHVMYLLCIGGHFFGYGGQLGDILHDLVV